MAASKRCGCDGVARDFSATTAAPGFGHNLIAQLLEAGSQASSVRCASQGSNPVRRRSARVESAELGPNGCFSHGSCKDGHGRTAIRVTRLHLADERPNTTLNLLRTMCNKFTDGDKSADLVLAHQLLRGRPRVCSGGATQYSAPIRPRLCNQSLRLRRQIPGGAPTLTAKTLVR